MRQVGDSVLNILDILTLLISKIPILSSGTKGEEDPWLNGYLLIFCFIFSIFVRYISLSVLEILITNMGDFSKFSHFSFGSHFVFSSSLLGMCLS